MVEFIVIGLPRSGTTWMANWLTTDGSLCLHDPFSNLYPRDLDRHPTKKTLGISCTGAFMMKWFQRQNCPIVAIERDLAQIWNSLVATGYESAPDHLPSMAATFALARGRRYQFSDLWVEEKAREMWAYLLPKIPFDVERYNALKIMNVQPQMSAWKPDLAIVNELIKTGELSCHGE